MLGCTCTIHRGIQWPRYQCYRSYAQHRHGRLQGFFPTHPIIFSCVPELLVQQKGKYSCAPEILAQCKSSITSVFQSSRSTQKINHSSVPELPTQHKTLIILVLQSFPLNTKHLINHVLQGPCPTQTNIYIYHQ